MSRYKEGIDRNQLNMIPMSLDDMISEDNVVRALDLIVDSLHIEVLNFKYNETAETGQKPYDPSDMFKLYIYSYYNGIRSSRKIERECHRNIEVMWLVHGLKPDHKTISEFRRNNKGSIQQAFRKFSLLCNDLGLISKEFVAVDGSKFRASNSKDQYYSSGKVSSLINYYTEAAERYLNLLEQNDKVSSSEQVDIESVKKRLERANIRLQELEQIQNRVETDGPFCITDPDSKNMIVNNGGHDISYNVQIAVEPTSHIVLAVDTTNEGMDYKQLHNMSQRAKDTLGTDELTVVADRGYYSKAEFEKCKANKIMPIVPKPLRGHSSDTAYLKNNFIYDKKNDVYVCPRGEVLIPRPGSKTNVTIYRNSKACKNCPEHNDCSSAISGRRITRRPDDNFADEVDERTQVNSALVHKRKCLVEHCFGIVKRMFGSHIFLPEGWKM